VSALGIWQQLAERLMAAGNLPLARVHETLQLLFRNGNLSARMMGRLGKTPNAAAIVALYRELARCLATNQLLTWRA
jgi:hypothetical protein